MTLQPRLSLLISSLALSTSNSTKCSTGFLLVVASLQISLLGACGSFPHGPLEGSSTSSTTIDSKTSTSDDTSGSTTIIPQSTSPIGESTSSSTTGESTSQDTEESGSDNETSDTETSDTDDDMPCKPWTEQFGTPEEDVGNGIAVDAEGNIYVTGHTKGDLDKNVSAGFADMFIAKYDSRGTELWTKQLGTPSEDKGTGIAIDSSGHVYITGHTGGSLHGNLTNSTTDAFLVKYASDG